MINATQGDDGNPWSWHEGPASEDVYDTDKNDGADKIIVPIVFALVGLFFCCLSPLERFWRGIYAHLQGHRQQGQNAVQQDINETIIIKEVLSCEEAHSFDTGTPETKPRSRITKRLRNIFIPVGSKEDIVSHVSEESDSEEGEENPHICRICLEPFHVHDSIAISKYSQCHHAFHRDCISSWLRRDNSCPCCRRKFAKIESGSKTLCGMCKGFCSSESEKEDMLLRSKFCVVHGLVLKKGEFSNGSGVEISLVPDESKNRVDEGET